MQNESYTYDACMNGATLSCVQEDEYRQKARESWDIAWGMLWSSDWKHVTGDNLDSGLISSMHCGKFGKAFMVEVSL